ncbi:MAG: hypothetical protein HFH52_12685 [Lachnospiraceae bacterium]|nr:hypothetical protein [Lachnospiraceae bacterium]
MYNPQKLMEEYQEFEPGEARLSAIRQAIQEADLANDYRYMMFFRYDYACSCDDNYLLYLYVIFPEILELFESHPEIQMPAFCSCTAAEAVNHIFSRVLDCADFFYQISVSDMEQYLKKYKSFCLAHGYSLFVYHMASARLYRAAGDKEKAMHSLHEFRLMNRSHHLRDAETVAFEGEMACWYGDLDNLLKAGKLLETRYYDEYSLIFQYGRLVYHYAVRLHDTKHAAPYFKKMERIRKKQRMHSCYFADSIVYLALTDLQAAWSFFKEEAPYQSLTYTPLDKMEFCTGAEIMMRALLKLGKKNVRLCLPSKLPYYQPDGCYRIEALAEYYGTEARDISRKFDLRNGNNNSIKEYQLFLNAVKHCIL